MSVKLCGEKTVFLCTHFMFDFLNFANIKFVGGYAKGLMKKFVMIVLDITKHFNTLLC